MSEKGNFQKNKIKQHVKKVILSTKKETLCPKQANLSSTPTSIRRLSSEKSKQSKSSSIAFNPDPLNLSALCNKKDGKISPVVMSPSLDRSQHFEPGLIHPLDIKDPLNLNADDQSLMKAICRKRKRKRRNTGGFLVDAEDILTVGNISTDNLNKSEDLTEGPTSKKSEFNKPALEGKTQKNVMKDEGELEASDTNTGYCKNVCSTGLQFDERKMRYRYGNYVDYYDGLRRQIVEQRLNLFLKEWFEGKNCLDIGCNTGKVTLLIAKHFVPEKIVGVDIDPNLIKIAKKKAKEFKMADKDLSRYPVSFSLTYGPIVETIALDSKRKDFPNNIFFFTENFVPKSSEILETINSEYDCILCLNVTKWIHLNFGDNGLKLFFKKIFLLLKPGGRLILEPQSYNSYKKKKNLLPVTLKNFQDIKLMPTDFISYLLSSEIGFRHSECLTSPKRVKSGSNTSIYLLIKGEL